MLRDVLDRLDIGLPGRRDAVTLIEAMEAAHVPGRCSVAAACALRLVADGVLGLDDDVNERLTSWRIPADDGWQPRVTVRHPLAHTGATTVSGFIGYPRGAAVPSVPQLLDGRGNSLPVRVSGLPGLRVRYPGGGYVILQQLLADVTGTDYATLARFLLALAAGALLPQHLADQMGTPAADAPYGAGVPVARAAGSRRRTGAVRAAALRRCGRRAGG